MDKMMLEALKAGVLAGSLIAALFGLPLLGAAASMSAASSGGAPDSYYALIGTLYQCLCALPFFSTVMASVSSVAALKWSRSVLVSLNDAMKVSLLTSALTACIGTLVPLIVYDLLAFYYRYASPIYDYSLLLGVLGLGFFGALSFFGGLMYSVYMLNLRYVHRETGNEQSG